MGLICATQASTVERSKSFERRKVTHTEIFDMTVPIITWSSKKVKRFDAVKFSSCSSPLAITKPLIASDLLRVSYMIQSSICCWRGGDAKPIISARHSPVPSFRARTTKFWFRGCCDKI